MKKIGIVLRSDKSQASNDIYLVNKEIIDVLVMNNVDYELIIPNNNLDNITEKYSGFLFQGGSEYNNYDLEIIKICQKNNIPVLGICLGMQLMGLCNGGNLEKIDSDINHNQKNAKVHSVYIKKSSLLYKIVEFDKIVVNSRHNDQLTKTTLNVTSRAIDNVIESIEDPNCKCFIGIGWHLETNYEYDIVSKKIFNYFFKCVGEYYEYKKNN